MSRTLHKSRKRLRLQKVGKKSGPDGKAVLITLKPMVARMPQKKFETLTSLNGRAMADLSYVINVANAT